MTGGDDADCVRLTFRLDRQQISYVKWVVEAYDGLAVVSSEAGRGELQWLVPRARLDEARALAAALAAEVGLVALREPTCR